MSLLHLLAALPWTIPWFGLVRLARKQPDLADIPPADGPLVSVIIPARNESSNIERVIRSVLATSYPAVELLVVDDRSTDDTAARAAILAADDPRFTLIRGAELPAGWFGKPWACWQGVRQARGDVLVFTDADTTHQPALLGHAVGALERLAPGLLTLAPRQRCDSFWERVIMPHFWFILGFRYHPDRVNTATRGRDVIANGQFIMVRRDTYDAIGGHEAVRGEVAEDLALAQRIVGSGRRVFIAFAESLIETRMYQDLRQLVEGWSKNVYLGGRQSFPDEPIQRALAPVTQMLAMLFWLIPPAILVLAAGGYAAGWVGAAVLATGLSFSFWLVTYFGMGLPIWYAFGYPLGAAMTLYIFARSAFRGARNVAWRGRVYDTTRGTVASNTVG